MAATNRIASTMQISIWSRSFSCHGLFVLTADRQRHSAKLKSTSCLAWSLVNGRKSRLKALSNVRFLPILVDEKRGGEQRSKKREVKVKAAFSKDVFLIISSHWPTLCLPETDIGICGKGHLRKNGRYGASIADGNREVDNLGTDTVDRDGRANNPGTGIADNLGIGITDRDGGADDLGTGTIDRDGRADDPSTGTADGDGGADNPGIGIGVANGEVNDPTTGIATQIPTEEQKTQADKQQM